MELQEIIAEIQWARQFTQKFAPPVGPLMDMGLELAQLIAGFVAEEEQSKAMDQLRALIRSGMTASVDAELAAKDT